MLIASACRHIDPLQAILKTGPISEKDRQQALEQAERDGDPQITHLLSVSRSRLLK